MYSTRGVDFHFQAEASLVLLRVDEDVASSRDHARLSERAVARQRRVAGRYSTAGGSRGSRACEENGVLAACTVCSQIEDSVALFTCVACGEELPSYQP